MFDPRSLDAIALERLDPAAIMTVAHETAAIIVRTGRASNDPALTDRLVRLVEEVGLSTVAELWSERPARSLPGALWRLYVLREWVRRDPSGASSDYRAGLPFADVSVVVAGVGNPPGPDEVRRVADEILRGVFDADFADALERASAFCRVVAAGRASRDSDNVLGTQTSASQAAHAANVLRMGDDLAVAARLWRSADLI